MKHCIERGCKEPRQPGGYLRCAKHRNPQRRARYTERHAGRLGATCLICGMGPYVSVGGHARQVHGVSRMEYRQMYPDADMTHPDLKDAFAYDATFKEGFRLGRGRPRQRTCNRGHSLRAPFIRLRVRRDGKTERVCLACEREHGRERRRKRREESGTKLCECGCGTTIPRISSMGTPQRFAKGHSARVQNVRRDARGRYSPTASGSPAA